MRYRLKIQLLSETIIGSGVSVPGSVDNDVVYDAFGLPYVKGKTIKGNLRELTEDLIEYLELDRDISIRLFGQEGIYNVEEGILNISDCQLSSNVTGVINNAINDKQIYIQEIKEALTNERYFTQIENGIAKDHSLRSIRTIEPGLILYADINTSTELTWKEEGILASAVSMFRNFGLMRTRGKGLISCSLLKDDIDITISSISRLEGRS